MSRFIYYYAEYHYAERRYAERRYAECRYAEWRNVECRGANKLECLCQESFLSRAYLWGKIRSYLSGDYWKL